ncbi:hypothetical protein DB30_00939 [Enhygromyxa salina]|uniref:Uncharacterized protein n=1 Tax=Enhygromyxa salina TaxID=215803 RepID=A0A0C2CYF1_9BACT|nr:hypothetical protein [Enhygromyxa salina]KIG12872.1 hypothetical protein DB30_00939 [Enhygromyxa salina]
MAKTMYWRVVPGVVHIVAHTHDSPTDEDWDAYLADVIANLGEIKGVLVYTLRAGPSASQRARSNEAFSRAGVEVQTVIMTASRVTQGIVTALSWAVGAKIKAFSTHDFAGAVACLGLDMEEQIKARVVLKQLARAAEIEIDAFADESGKFRQRLERK